MPDSNDDRPRELSGLPREITPPERLRDRITADLRSRGLVRSPRSTRLHRAAFLLLPLLAGFAAGWMLKPASGPSEGHQSGQPRYVLLLYGGTTSTSGDPVREYGSWAQRLVAAGTPVSGEKLAPVRFVVGAPLADTAHADLGGFFIVQAADDQRARELALSHPHVRRGGTIVVRRIDPT
jgi:hypothetical protein